MRMLMLPPALPKTTEVCSAISTSSGWGTDRRGRRRSRNGGSEGRSEESHPEGNGERGDFQGTGGRIDWERGRMNR